MVYKAVIFDSSGVTMSFEKIPWVVDLMATLKLDPAAWQTWRDLEMGIGFCKNSNQLFEATLNANSDLKKKVLEAMTDDSYFSIFDNMVEDPYVAAVLPKLKEAGLKTCLLTNNMYRDETRTRVYAPESIFGKFDANILSCRDALRKPNEDCFMRACKKLDVKPEECIFIDDFPENCVGARALGITAIYVHGTDIQGALRELEELLGLELL